MISGSATLGKTTGRYDRGVAGRYALPLLFVHVHDGAPTDADVARLLREAMATGEAELAIESGHPADRIVELAQKRDATFVVVGNHGPRSSLLGSVSAEVARRSPCPVLVVPPGTDRVELALTPAAADVEN